MNIKQIKWMNNMPEIYRNGYKKAMLGKSKSTALKQKCLDCVCWQRTEIDNCGVETCPLYPYRPYQKARNRSSASALGTLEKKSKNGADV